MAYRTYDKCTKHDWGNQAVKKVVLLYLIYETIPSHTRLAVLLPIRVRGNFRTSANQCGTGVLVHF